MAVFGYPAFLALLLGVLILGDPGRIDRQSRWLRATTGLMIASITLAAAITAVRLVVGILQGASFAGAHELLAIGAIVWTTLVLAIALWYWHLDSGGPAARADGSFTTRPAFRFPEHDIDSPAYAGWYPQFVDYFALHMPVPAVLPPGRVGRGGCVVSPEKQTSGAMFRAAAASTRPPLALPERKRTPTPAARPPATELANSTLVTFDGDGHTAYASAGSGCVDDPIDAYYVDGTPPPAELKC